LTGKYPTLCDHSKLGSADAIAVKNAERAENLKVCMSGKYPTLCKHNLLLADELRAVTNAEAAENLRVCLDGRYPTLCKHSALTPQQSKDAAAAEARAAADRSQTAASAPVQQRNSRRCEEGHWIETVSGDGAIIKLEDGSLWQVDAADTVTSSIWLPTSEVVLCSGKMINTDDDESIGVSRLSALPASPAVPTASRTQGYLIEASANDETFVINGEVFKAKTYCFNFNKGDRVLFVSGSPSGVCVSARLLNLRSQKTCDVWCE
jgi:hypothetical protein